MKKKVLIWSLLSLLALGFVASSTLVCWMSSKIDAYEAKHGGSVLLNLDSDELDELVRKQIAVAQHEADVEKAGSTRTMGVVKVGYDGDRELRVYLTTRPDMEVARDYVSVGPMDAGQVDVSYVTEYDASIQDDWPVLRVRGDFAFSTNVTLRIRAGLPRYGQAANPDRPGVMPDDFVYSFQRKDPAPSVVFADRGRYLPAGGKRVIRLETLNVTNVLSGICRVEPRNIVQLLAREKRVYQNYWQRTVDSEATLDLSGAMQMVTNTLPHRFNERQNLDLPVAVADGKSANGVYLLKARIGNLPVCEYVGYWNRQATLNPERYRLVCLTDLGLTVRKFDQDGLGVWVTSLMTGEPVAGAIVEVYSQANTLIMSGTADEQGWCRPVRCDAGEPFAVVVYAEDGSDMTFLSIRETPRFGETYATGARPDYLAPDALEAFLWSDRGIYRHGEPILLHTLVRTGTRQAPQPLPLQLKLISPLGAVYSYVTLTTDAEGAMAFDQFVVPADQPSGEWKIVAQVPGEKGRILGTRTVKIEEFAPPQVRVAVEADEKLHPSNFVFTVSGEHLFGGPAHNLACAGAVVFEDLPFAPKNWAGWTFGNETLGLKPSFRELARGRLDREGRYTFDAPIWASTGLPKAAVRVTAQGVVFEDGGRPATTRKSVVSHYYPYYIGSTLPARLHLETGVKPRVALACVTPQGEKLASARTLQVNLERIDSIYSYQTDDNGDPSWTCQRVRVNVLSNATIVVSAETPAELELPILESGDFTLTVEDPETRVSFARTFYASDWGDTTVRAPLANPTEVTIVPDQAHYRVGETPRLMVKAPFAGTALLSVMRGREVYTEVVALTNATAEIALKPVTLADAPSVDVTLSVVQSVAANARRLAARAYGQTTIAVRPQVEEIPVALETALPDLRHLTVRVAAPQASAVVVTVVDEGINLLTGEQVPDPIGYFARLRDGNLALWDIFSSVLPVYGFDGLKVGGVKTGGGFGAEMLGRVSPVPTRRFKPLALWSGRLPVQNGRAEMTFDLPPFVGEVRVSAVAYSPTASGAAAVQQKVTPRLVTQPDAPRFVAPKDVFEATLPIHNRSGADVVFAASIAANGVSVLSFMDVPLAKDASTNLIARITAPDKTGELTLTYSVCGAGEVHTKTIDLPVRPAFAATVTSGVTPASEWTEPTDGSLCVTHRLASPADQLDCVRQWLKDYPYGCLEQTVSCAAANPTDAALRRVESMVRAHDFVMWPDCTYAPWDPEVSLAAAKFLFEAERRGVKLNSIAREMVREFLPGWAARTNLTSAAAAVEIQALAGCVDRSRLFELYDATTNLSVVARARLARTFLLLDERKRADVLLRDPLLPGTVQELAETIEALVKLNPDDPRLLVFVTDLIKTRNAKTLAWETTADNASALRALEAYYTARPPKAGDELVAWQTFSWETPAEPIASGLTLTRRFLTPEGEEAKLNDLRCGELLIAELSLTSPTDTWFNDLVIEDLFAGALEPVFTALPESMLPNREAGEVMDWIMRSDARDDRMLVFSKKFYLEKGHAAKFRYPVRVVSAGDFILPGPSVEGMYHPALRARCVPGRLVVHH